MQTFERTWSDLLISAVTQPGSILAAYSAFHNYSIGNQVAALAQCHMRGLSPGPINTFNGWQRLNRHVKKGEKALWLCIPITRKVENDKGEEETVVSSFVWKPRFFVIGQTEGEPYQMPEIPGWNKEAALKNLGIRQIPFDMTNGNVLGFARRNEFAVSPLSPLPHKTMLHELSHIVLGHTADTTFSDTEHTPKNLREVEAESCAYILCEALQLEGSEYSIGYIRSWLDGDIIPERSAQKIFSACDRILKAGRESNP